jgi:hypothetical protein
MRLAIVCAAIVIAGLTAAEAHERKLAVTRTMAPPCAGLSDTVQKGWKGPASTGTLSPAWRGAANEKPEPPLGYIGDPWIIPNFGL